MPIFTDAAVGFVGNHVWQSTLFAVVAGLLALVVRQNRAHAAYWLWFAASIKFLLPFSLLVALGRQVGWRTVDQALESNLAVFVETIAEPFSNGSIASVPAVSVTTMPAHPSVLPFMFAAIWLAGCAALLVNWWRRWRHLTQLVRDASVVEQGRELTILRRLEQLNCIRRSIRLVSSDTEVEPGVFGIYKPVLLWPGRISAHLSDRQVEAILAHEVAHIRRRDNAIGAAHMTVQSIFWFHPIVWWLGARLLEARERACDQDVLLSGNEPQTYAEGILKTCEFCIESPRLYTAGVMGSDLQKRIEAIMRNDAGVPLTGWRKALVATAALAAIAGPLIAGGLSAPAVHAQSSAAGAGPAFEAASVKPNKSGDNSIRMQALPGGRINVNNATLRLLIRNAYTVQDFQIVGGPDWINSDRFDIAATSSGNPTQPQVQMMLRRLLAGRFKLTLHPETRELPVYALMLARSDRRLGPRLRTAEPCFRSPVNGPPQQPPLLGPGPCGFTVGSGRSTAKGVTMGAFAASLSNSVGRIVQDRTGLSGNFDLELEFTPDQTLSRPGGAPDAPSPPPAEGGSIFTAVHEQLGLKLEPQRGPVDVLVIDRAERPTEN